MTQLPAVLQVYQTGPLTVVGFGRGPIPPNLDIAACRNEVFELVRVHACQTIAFDLTGVPLIPSGLLGLLASLRQQGLEIHLYNPSDDVRDVLEITQLDRLLPVHDVEV
jgi:anti-anti-sigma factor